MSKRNDLMTTEEAALYVRLSPRTLERYRVTGRDRRFSKTGGVCSIAKPIWTSGSRTTGDVRRPTPARNQTGRRRSGRRAGVRARASQSARPGVTRRTPTRSRRAPERGGGGEARRGLAAHRRRSCAVVRRNRRSGACEVLTEAGASRLVAQRRGRRNPPPAQRVGACGRPKRSGRSASLLDRLLRPPGFPWPVPGSVDLDLRKPVLAADAVFPAQDAP